MKEMKSIAVILPELLPVPPVRGGAVEHWVHEVTTRMALHGWRIAVIARPAGISGHPDIEYLGIPWTASELRFNSLKNAVSWKNPLRYLAKIQNVWSYGRRAARAARGFDLIYVQNEPNLLLFLEKRPGQRIVLHMHNDHLSSAVLRGVYRRVLAKVDTVLCVSEFIRRRALALYPEHANLFKAVLNATDPEVFKPYDLETNGMLATTLDLKEEDINLLYVGRLVAIKGVHVLLRAFREVYRTNPRVRLIIAGSSFFEGASRNAYEESLRELAAPVKQAIRFTGFLPHTTLKYLYSLAEIVVVPSVWQDPCPLVVLEAMASGTCVVASNVGGISELIEDQRTGLLVPGDDASALCFAITRLLDDPAGRSRMEQAARAAVVARYTWERLVDNVENELGEVR